MRLHMLDGETQVRYVATRMWIKILLFAVPAAFFMGAEYGKQDTRAGYARLIQQLPSACREDYGRIVRAEPR